VDQLAKCAKAWLATSAFGPLVAACCGDPTREQNWKTYPLMSDAYDQERLFKNNRWWSSLPDTYKSTWEAQLRQPDAAYALCFRDKMPEDIALGGTHFSYDAERLREHLLIQRYLLEKLIAKPARRRTPTHAQDIGALELRIEQLLLQQVLLPIRFLQEQEQQQQQQQQQQQASGSSCWGAPEMTLEGFQSLCVTQRWAFDHKIDVTCKRPNRRQTDVSRMHEVGGTCAARRLQAGWPISPFHPASYVIGCSSSPGYLRGEGKGGEKKN
jgi:hypothetical protein